MEPLRYVIEYQGGGYEGCFWEWNFFICDTSDPSQCTRFADIFSSGRNGIVNLAGAHKLTDEEDYTAYDLDDEEDVERFQKGTNPVLVLGVYEWLGEHLPEKQFAIKCTKCGIELEEPSRYDLAGWHGCGGIASAPDDLLCRCCAEQSNWESWIKDEFVSELGERDIDIEEEEEDFVVDLFRVGSERSCEYIDACGDECHCDVGKIAEEVAESYPEIRREILCEDEQLTIGGKT